CPSCWRWGPVEQCPSRRAPLPPSGARRITLGALRAYPRDRSPPMPHVRPPADQRRTNAGRPRGRPRLVGALLARLALTSAHAKDSLMASPYGPVLIDLLAAFQAVETPCPSASVQHDLCFDATPAGATQLAEALSEVVGGYATAGLGVGDWRAANGVW